MVSQGLPWWASRREGMVRDAKGGPTVPQRNRLIVDNKLPLSSMPNNTMSTMRFVEYVFFFVKVDLTCTQFPHFRKHWFLWNIETQGPCDCNQLLWWQDRWICVTSWCGFVSLVLWICVTSCDIISLLYLCAWIAATIAREVPGWKDIQRIIAVK